MSAWLLESELSTCFFEYYFESATFENLTTQSISSNMVDRLTLVTHSILQTRKHDWINILRNA